MDLVRHRIAQKPSKEMKVDYEFTPTNKGCKVKVTLTYKTEDITDQVLNDYMDFIHRLLVAAANNLLKH
ncbi:hypothetical protein NL676_037947 [Syzygium grande]|nr:hypothetical protein NL676_037947 [Syzygium grande]